MPARREGRWRAMTDSRAGRDRDDERMAHVEDTIERARRETTETQEEGVFDEDDEVRERATESGPDEPTFIEDSDAAHDPEGVEDDTLSGP
jgi:hypothetical protein